MQTSSREQRDYHHGPSKVNRETRIQCPSNTASTTSRLILAAFANPDIKTFEMLSPQSTFRQGCNRQTFLVDRNLRIFNEKSLTLSPIDLCIPTDAFTKGCGSTYLQISTGGLWSQMEWKAPINILEMKALHLTILTFTKFRIVQRLHVQMDNKVVLSYQVKMEGTHSQQGPSWPLQINMGLSTVEKDYNYCIVLSRLSECDSRLGVLQFSGQGQLETFPRSICKNLSEIRYTQYWLFGILDVSSTLTLHGMEARSRKSGNQCYLSTTGKTGPICHTPIQPNTQGIGRYSVLLRMCIYNPLLLAHQNDLLLDTPRKTHPLVANQTLRLAAWLVSGNHWHQKAFQTKLQNLYQTQKRNFNLFLVIGLAPVGWLVW